MVFKFAGLLLSCVHVVPRLFGVSQTPILECQALLITGKSKTSNNGGNGSCSVRLRSAICTHTHIFLYTRQKHKLPGALPLHCFLPPIRLLFSLVTVLRGVPNFFGLYQPKNIKILFGKPPLSQLCAHLRWPPSAAKVQCGGCQRSE